MNSLTALTALTMSSVEISQLTEKRHDHVIRDIEKMIDTLGLGRPNFGGTYLSAQNKVLKCYNLPKDLTVTLVSGYNIKMRHAITTRWLELEGPKIPQTYSEALRLAADQAETIEKQTKLIQQLTPYEKIIKRMSGSSGDLLVRDAAKVMSGEGLEICQKSLFEWLRRNKWVISTGSSKNRPYQSKIYSGHLRLRATEYERTNGVSYMSYTPLITPKGLIAIAKKLEGENV